ncbi:hypothetical protein TRFO_28791 [Tritrichomonas foetus]|uniref:Uncharacterized protein n=1 Tax=Tritrichomonas foetus TaxID=1144522 RepID=A0A1J4JZH1_9EUKA|nr:hypothetical protein TRFO_28791 [Tritrichomonas foetus]|eukprot:OHT03888.1 hypothetical protein TRFO_28791 [Tritrichomonas foetus]
MTEIAESGLVNIYQAYEDNQDEKNLLPQVIVIQGEKKKFNFNKLKKSILNIDQSSKIYKKGAHSVVVVTNNFDVVSKHIESIGKYKIFQIFSCKPENLRRWCEFPNDKLFYFIAFDNKSKNVTLKSEKETNLSQNDEFIQRIKSSSEIVVVNIKDDNELIQKNTKLKPLYAFGMKGSNNILSFIEDILKETSFWPFVVIPPLFNAFLFPLPDFYYISFDEPLDFPLDIVKECDDIQNSVLDEKELTVKTFFGFQNEKQCRKTLKDLKLFHFPKNILNPDLFYLEVPKNRMKNPRKINTLLNNIVLEDRQLINNSIFFGFQSESKLKEAQTNLNIEYPHFNRIEIIDEYQARQLGMKNDEKYFYAIFYEKGFPKGANIEILDSSLTKRITRNRIIVGYSSKLVRAISIQKILSKMISQKIIPHLPASHSLQHKIYNSEMEAMENPNIDYPIFTPIDNLFYVSFTQNPTPVVLSHLPKVYFGIKNIIDFKQSYKSPRSNKVKTFIGLENIQSANEAENILKTMKIVTCLSRLKHKAKNIKTQSNDTPKISNEQLIFKPYQEYHYLYFKEKFNNIHPYQKLTTKLFGISNIDDLQRFYHLNTSDANKYTFLGFKQINDRNAALTNSGILCNASDRKIYLFEKSKLIPSNSKSLNKIQTENKLFIMKPELFYIYFEENDKSRPPSPTNTVRNLFGLKNISDLQRNYKLPNDNRLFTFVGFKTQEDFNIASNSGPVRSNAKGSINHIFPISTEKEIVPKNITDITNVNNKHPKMTNEIKSLQLEEIELDKNTVPHEKNIKQLEENNINSIKAKVMSQAQTCILNNMQKINQIHLSNVSNQNHHKKQLQPENIQYKVFVPKENLCYIYFEEKENVRPKESIQSDKPLFRIKNLIDSQRSYYLPDSSSQKVYTFLGFSKRRFMMNAIETSNLKSNAVDQAYLEFEIKPILQPRSFEETQPKGSNLNQKNNLNLIKLNKVIKGTAPIQNDQKTPTNNSNPNAKPVKEFIFQPKEKLFYIYFKDSNRIEPTILHRKKFFGVQNVVEVHRKYFHPFNKKQYTFIGFANKADMDNGIEKIALSLNSKDKVFIFETYQQKVLQSLNIEKRQYEQRIQQKKTRSKNRKRKNFSKNNFYFISVSKKKVN